MGCDRYGGVGLRPKAESHPNSNTPPQNLAQKHYQNLREQRNYLLSGAHFASTTEVKLSKMTTIFFLVADESGSLESLEQGKVLRLEKTSTLKPIWSLCGLTKDLLYG
ncbi:uncharacterized protein PAC_16186 [Phialocephala subalpina]|uniref:Uncharacterized protein n=1 Tax=Phialocephala subalpina TaxID=576137 RepID=A0A1L7XML5_9HELO|nr:uncharacterized protein PAC_16186 [Phialocephala subalpina]